MAVAHAPWRPTPENEADQIDVSKKGLEELRRQAEARAREIDWLRRRMPSSVGPCRSTKTRTSPRVRGNIPPAMLGPGPSFRPTNPRSPAPSPATRGSAASYWSRPSRSPSPPTDVRNAAATI